MSFQLLKANVAVALLAASSAPLFAASVAPQVHAPAQFRIDFTRPGGLPGAPRDVAGYRDFGGPDATVQYPVRHKRRPHKH